MCANVHLFLVTHTCTHPHAHAPQHAGLEVETPSKTGENDDTTRPTWFISSLFVWFLREHVTYRFDEQKKKNPAALYAEVKD